MPKNSIVGFPRIGERRELKFALEDFWNSKIAVDELEDIAVDLRKKHLKIQLERGVELISINDFSYYDNMLDMSVALGAIPERFRDIDDKMELYFTMARGDKKRVAMEMTKWFNTNYHYIVPELSTQDNYKVCAKKIQKEYEEAKELNIKPKVNIIGLLTFLNLSKIVDSKDKLELLPPLEEAYLELFAEISKLDSEVFVQIDEPIFVTSKGVGFASELKRYIDKLCRSFPNLKITVSTYFEHASELVDVLKDSNIFGLGLDFVYGEKNMDAIFNLKDSNIKLFAGVVDGRNIWRNNLAKTVELLKRLEREIGKDRVVISSSCSLLHTPYSVELEDGLDEELKNRLSFTLEKLDEISLLTKLFYDEPLTKSEQKAYEQAQNIRCSSDVKMDNITNSVRDGEFQERISIQKDVLKLPILPTTTIGSFPQTKEVRSLRLRYKRGEISTTEYKDALKKLTKECIEFQEKIGLDVLVHGEFERNDMVEYFGEQLDGFAFSSFGWVQSYGSRCVKPPIIHGDIKRKRPMTVEWIEYAQSLTDLPVKGMLTGPATIINWSFERVDIKKEVIASQIALALRDEISDLQDVGIKIVQVDEAAFKEGYPLRDENREAYEKWTVENFKLSVSSAKKETQIHTHMCYSEFNDIIKTIEAMDADVISIETSRSGNKLLKIFRDVGYTREIGPGVYDIHSPRVPSVKEIESQIEKLLEVLPKEQLWVNPDCGLKTRKWEEVEPSLKNMVEATKNFR